MVEQVNMQMVFSELPLLAITGAIVVILVYKIMRYQVKDSLSKSTIVRSYGIAGLTIQLVGFALGLIVIGLFPGVAVGMGEGTGQMPILSQSGMLHLSDDVYVIGLVAVVAVAVRVDVPKKYLLPAAVGIGLSGFYKFANHSIHITSGIGFGLSHVEHIAMGTVLGTFCRSARGANVRAN